MDNKLLSPAEIEQMVESTADDIKWEMEIINRKAVEDFYSYESEAEAFPYYRTEGFYDLGNKPEEIKKGNTLELVYKYSASDLRVNEWLSPWGILYHGEPAWAFDTGFVHGFHGGPTFVSGFGWKWLAMESTPIWELIVKGVKSLK